MNNDQPFHDDLGSWCRNCKRGLNLYLLSFRNENTIICTDKKNYYLYDNSANKNLIELDIDTFVNKTYMISELRDKLRDKLN